MNPRELQDHGFTIARQLVDDATLRQLESCVQGLAATREGRRRRGELFGLRNLLAEIPELRALARSSGVRAVVEPSLGSGAAAVRGIYFDKTPAANWRLGWHRDRAIAVRERHDVAGYGSWSVKAGVDHVFPPIDILAKMLTVRIHLDVCDVSNGALRVIPGSHREPALTRSDFQRLAAESGVEVCAVERGDAVVMCPLLAHASDRAREPAHRRVIHLEYASAPLPKPLEWNEYVAFS